LLVNEANPETKSFSEFVSTPIFSSIRYGPIAIVVDGTRFQITDNGYFEHPETSVIVEMTRRYFGDLLKYTPLDVCGINFNGRVKFVGPDDERDFDSRLGIDRKSVEALAADGDSLKVSTTMRFRRRDAWIEIQASRPRDAEDACDINMNHESKLKSKEDLLERIAEFATLHREFSALLRSLGIEENT
jgi:hypothetical protein